MSLLALSFLGSPLIERDGAVIELKLRKSMALLAYLAVTGQRHSRDALAELLYPDKPRGDSRSDIRRSLSVLRGTLSTELLDSDRNCVWCTLREGTRVDVVDFRRLISQSRDLERDGDLPGSSARIEKAVDLYRGEFLSGLFSRNSPAFEEWQLLESETLKREQCTALRRLVETRESMGQITQAIEYARRLLRFDILEESSHRTLMRLQALAGQRSEAVNQYRACQRILLKELGQEPEEETKKLREAIVAGRLAAIPQEERPRATSQRRGPMSPAMSEGVDADHVVVMATDGEDAGCTTFPDMQAAVLAALARLKSPTALDERVALHADCLRDGKGTPVAILAKRAHTILGAAQPGQALLSDCAAALVSGAAGAGARSLGAHRLQDLGPPVALFQLVHPDLREEFLPLRTLETLPNNLPSQPTLFVGREVEMASIARALLSDVRLLTLTGPGGTGKTRLALQAAAGMADRFSHGVFFVDLSTIRDPGQVMLTVAATLGVQEIAGERPVLEVLTGFLKARNVLLVLDNFEHLLDAASEVAVVLAACPLVKVLVTSRESLRLRGEQELPVPPLMLPPRNEPATTLDGFEAVRFFVDRASEALPGFSITEENAAVVAGICVRLDGLPLAMELAAARLKALSPAAMLERLESRHALRMVGPRDLPPRQQTLLQEIDWSYELLTDSDKRLFRRLSVFAGGCTLETAQAMCSLEGDAATDVVEGLVSLVGKNLLVRRDQRGQARYHMLQTIGDLASEHLGRSGETDEVHRRFTAWFLELAERAKEDLHGPARDSTLDRLDQELGNLLSALAWLREQKDRLRGARLAGALGEFWFDRLHYVEGHHWLEVFRELSQKDDPPAPRAELAFHLGRLKLWFEKPYAHHGEITLEYFQEAIRIGRESGNTRIVAHSLAWMGIHCLLLPREVRWNALEEAVHRAREADSPWLLAHCLMMANAGANSVEKSKELKIAAMEEAIDIATTVGDPDLIGEVLHGMGDVFLYLGDYAAARPWFLKANRLGREREEGLQVHASLYHLITIHLALGEVPQARAACREALRLSLEYNLKTYYPRLFRDCAEIAVKDGHLRRAARLRAAAELVGKQYPCFEPSAFHDLGLTEETARAEWSAAQSMSVDQQVAYALRAD